MRKVRRNLGRTEGFQAPHEGEAPAGEGVQEEKHKETLRQVRGSTRRNEGLPGTHEGETRNHTSQHPLRNLPSKVQNQPPTEET